MLNSEARRKGKNPAYWVSKLGVFSEVQLEGSRPLRWATEPLNEDQIKALRVAAKSPLEFARAVEKAHGVEPLKP